jgi:hypothetical protein
MPDYSHVSRDAGAAATVPNFAAIAARGARQRRRRRAAYVGGVALAVSGALGLSTLVRGDNSPQPTPTPSLDGLVFTRADGSTFRADDFTVSCAPDENATGTMLVVASTFLGPDRTGQVELSAPIELVAAGGTFQLPSRDVAGDPQPRLFVVDPLDGNELTTDNEGASGKIVIASARCGESPAISFAIAGVLDSELSDMPGVRVSGGVAAPIAPSPQLADTAADIVADPRSRARALAVSPTDPDVRVTAWQACPSDDRCAQRFAVAITDDGFKTRTVVDRVFRTEVTLAAGGDRFYVRGGWGDNGSVIALDGSLREVGTAPGRASGTGPVVALGDGPPIWSVIDLASATAHEIRPPEDGVPASSSLQVARLDDGRLAAVTDARDGSRARYHLSTDNGATWTGGTLDAKPGALWMFTRGKGLSLIEGGDGATLFPFSAAQRIAGDTATRVAQPGSPRAYVDGAVVLADDRLLVSVEAWSDEKPGGTAVTPPGLYVSDGQDWSTFSRVVPEFSTSDPREIHLIATVLEDDTVSIYVTAPPGDDNAAYRSDDGGTSWQPVALR